MESKKDSSDDNIIKPDEDVVTSSLGSEGESLEFTPTDTPETVVSPDKLKEADDVTASDDSGITSAITPGMPAKPIPKGRRLGAIWDRMNVYLLMFILIIVLSLAVVVVIFFQSRTTTTPEDSIAQQKLSSETLQELASNGVQVGDPKQVLSIQSNSVFAGTVLVKGELQVAGGLKLGAGGLNIPDLSVGGSAIINQLQTQALAVAGNAAVQGQLTVQQNISVNGNAAFNGTVTTPQLTTNRLQLSGDLTLTRHIVAGGGIPGRTNGGALGSGGTSSISGSDTAGTININTGGGASSGCLVTVNFNQAFSSTPHVSVTPIGAGAADLNYYINRSGGNFSVCSTNAPPSNQSFGFDYIILE